MPAGELFQACVPSQTFVCYNASACNNGEPPEQLRRSGLRLKRDRTFRLEFCADLRSSHTKCVEPRGEHTQGQDLLFIAPCRIAAGQQK